MRRDPVSHDVALAVLRRDQGCVAVTLGEDPASCGGRLTLDHVKDQPPVGAPVVKRGADRKHRYRAPSDTAHLVSVCARHHLETGWATSHRPELREYLASVAVT
jgi:hypothetical protein